MPGVAGHWPAPGNDARHRRVGARARPWDNPLSWVGFSVVMRPSGPGCVLTGCMLLAALLAAQQPAKPPKLPVEPGGKAAGAASAASTPAVAGSQTPATPTSQSAMAAQMHTNLRMMILVGRMARRQGATAAVRRCGDRIARDAALADRMLFSRADALGMHLSMSPPDMSSLQPLMNLSGPVFNQRFLTMMSQKDQMMIRMLSAAVATGGQSPMTDLIRKLLPVVRVHWQLAQNLLKPGAPA
ncbi:MAG: DUF4142 domain-containing protein [Terriglobales bacterium]